MNTHELEQLIREIAEHDTSFYRDRWGTRSGFAELPAITRADFIATPLSKRRYKDDRALVKIVHGDERFLSEWTFEDIGKESFGRVSARPLVYLSDPYEAIEKSMWCYEQGMVPLIGEKDPDIARFAADKYRIDSLITDMDALERFEPYFNDHDPIQSISVIGDSFDPARLERFAAYAGELWCVLALPEVGAFADALFLPGKPFVFKALPGAVIEREDMLVVTKASLLVTPVIRYRTAIPAAAYGA